MVAANEGSKLARLYEKYGVAAKTVDYADSVDFMAPCKRRASTASRTSVAPCFRHDLRRTGNPSFTTLHGKEGGHTCSPLRRVARNHVRSIWKTHTSSLSLVLAKRR